MSKTSSLTSRAAILAFGNGTTAVVQIVIAMVLARYLAPAAYGTYKQAYLVYNIAAPILGLGLPAALLYFLPRDESRGRGILTESMLILSLAGLGFSIFLLLGGATLFAIQFGNPALAPALRWFAIIPLLSLPRLAVAPCLIASNRAQWVAGYSISTALLRMLLVVIPVVLISNTEIVAIQANAAASALMFVPGVYLMYTAVRRGSIVVTGSGVLEQLKYAVPLGVGAMIGTIHKGMDKFIVSSMVSPAEAAIFFNGAMEIPFISLITGSAASVMVPELARLYSQSELGAALGLFQRSAVKCGMVLAPLSGWFFLSAPWIMTWLYGATYVDSTPIFRVYLLMLPLRVAFFGPLFQAAGRSDLVMTRSAIGFVGNVVLTIIGAWLFGPIGAAVGTVLSILLFAYSFCLVASAKLYETSVTNLLPLGQLAKLFLPIVLIVAVLLLCTDQFKLDQSLGLVGWIVLSLSYAVGVLAAYLALRIFTVAELQRQCQTMLSKFRAYVR